MGKVSAQPDDMFVEEELTRKGNACLPNGFDDMRVSEIKSKFGILNRRHGYGLLEKFSRSSFFLALKPNILGAYMGFRIRSKWVNRW
jgi:hypothetical protein